MKSQNISKELENYISTVSTKATELFLHFRTSGGNMEEDEAAVKLGEVLMTKAKTAKKYQEKIRLLPNGRYQIRVQGVNIMHSTIDAVIEHIMRVEAGEKTKKKKDDELTFAELAAMWLPYRKSKKAAGTYRKSCAVVNDLLLKSPLSSVSITQYAMKDLDDFWAYCKSVKPDITQKNWESNVMANMRNMMDYAISSGKAQKNLFTEYQIHQNEFCKKKKTKKEHKFFLPAEVDDLRDLVLKEAAQLKDARPLGPLFVYNTGIRDGELCEMRWNDLETISGRTKLHVQREQIEDVDDEGKHIGYKPIDHCKTPAGERYITLNEESLLLLELIKEYNLAKGISCDPNELIFQRIKKGQVLPCNIRVFDSRIGRYCKKLGIVRKSMHDLRRTFATMLYRNGMPIERLRVILGHTTTNQTLEYVIDYNADIDDFDSMNGLCSSSSVTEVGEREFL